MVEMLVDEVVMVVHGVEAEVVVVDMDILVLEEMVVHMEVVEVEQQCMQDQDLVVQSKV